LFRHEDAFVARDIGRLEESDVVDVVRRAPRKIHVMRTGLDEAVLEIMRVEQREAGFARKRGEIAQAVPIPGIVFGEVVFAEAVPRDALPAARKG
jgi:hypothetical protein